MTNGRKAFFQAPFLLLPLRMTRRNALLSLTIYRKIRDFVLSKRELIH